MSLTRHQLYVFGPFRLDVREGLLLRDGQPVPMPPKAYDLLVSLVAHAGHLVTKEELLREVWPETFVEEANLSYTVSLVRKALGDDSEPYRYIETVPKRGYRFREAVAGSQSGERAPDVRDVDARAEPNGVISKAGETVVSRHYWSVPRWLPWALSFVLVVTLVAVLVRRFQAPVPQRTTRLSLVTQPLAILDHAASPAVALSPDGVYVAYVAGDSGVGQLYVRKLDSLEATPIVGAEHVSGPFFSPDGEWIAFFGGESLQKVALRGGPPARICTLPIPESWGGHGASWGDDGSIIFEGGARLWRVSATGGKAESVGSGRMGLWPDVLPGSDAVIFTASGGPPESAQTQARGIYLFSFDTHVLRLLVPDVGIARYVHSGHLVYAAEGALFAAPFDLKTLQLTGPAAQVIAPIMMGLTNEPNVTEFAVSHSGTLAYLAGPLLRNLRTIVWVNRSGREETLLGEPGAYGWPRISADGSRLAFTILDNKNRSDVWIHDLLRQTTNRLTFDDANEDRPLWTPDGRRVVFSLGRSTARGSHLFWKAADGTGQSERLTNDLNRDPSAKSFSPDGSKLVFVQFNEETRWNIHVLDMKEARSSRPLLQTPFVEGNPVISPDGRWLAYRSNETGRYEIYVRPFPDVDRGKWQISTNGGNAPLWSPDVRELFYQSGRALMVAAVHAGASFSSERPRSLFEGPYFDIEPGLRHFDISPDGRRFVMIKDVQEIEASARDELTIVLNWFDELRRLAPIAR